MDEGVKQRKNSVRITRDGIIESVIRTDLDYETAYRQGDKVLEKIKQLNAEGKPIFIMHDALEMGIVSHEARKHIIEVSRATDFDRMAIVGKGTIIRLASNLMVQAIGKGDTVKFFHDRDQAIAWLKS